MVKIIFAEADGSRHEVEVRAGDHLIPILIEADSRDSQKRSNLNRCCKLEVCDGFSGFFADRL